MATPREAWPAGRQGVGGELSPCQRSRWVEHAGMKLTWWTAGAALVLAGCCCARGSGERQGSPQAQAPAAPTPPAPAPVATLTVQQQQRLEEYQSWLPAQRELAIHEHCKPKKGCEPDVDLVIASARTPEERTTLEELRALVLQGRAPKGSMAQHKAGQDKGVSPPAQPSDKRIRCCDGTVSPTCTTDRPSLRGCCSKHGGVCGP